MAYRGASALALIVLVGGCCSVPQCEPEIKTVYVNVPVPACPAPQTDLSDPPAFVPPDGEHDSEWYARFAGEVRAYIANLRHRLEGALAELRGYAEIAREVTDE